jgi:hypothetical protein
MYTEKVMENLDSLIKIDNNRIRDNSKKKLILLIKELLKISNCPCNNLSISSKKIIEADSKMNWVYEFIKIAKKNSKKIALLFTNEFQKLIFYRLFNEKKKF